jgi:cyclomaltodextrinase / maltogenic alpha-amylase / neopullulanase
VSEPGWVQHAVWWHVYPLGFVGAEAAADPAAPVRHRLGHLVGWLDYAVELGASGLALGPVFASETHGYDTVDHLRIDPRLGDDTDFDALVKAAGERGLRVLLDGVFNHVGRSHPRFVQALADGPGSRAAAWFRRDGADYATFEGHDRLVALNHAEPEVVEHVVEVMGHWLDRGASGWRLDAAYAVPRTFWAAVTAGVRAGHPDAYLVGEVIHGDYAGFVAESGMDSVTQYELWKAIWSGLNDRNLFELGWALRRHSDWVDDFAPLTFVGNHDVTRIASALTDERHLGHALAVLFCVGGTPSVYAGDEQAFRGVKEDRAGGDDAVRPAFPASPADLAPFGQPTYRLHQDLIGMRRRNPWLHRARTTPTTLANRNAVLESTDGEHRLQLALNLDALPVTLSTPGATAVLAGAGDLHDGQTTLAPHDWAVVGQ